MCYSQPVPATKHPIDVPKKITLKDLAQHLGLSRTTVSVVLNDSPLAQTIATKTRERIVKAAKELNYKPNYFARYLNERRSYLIGVLSPDLAEGYDAGVLSGIEEYLLHTEYSFFVASHQWSEHRVKRNSQLFLERGVEGVILINTEHGSDIALPLVRIGGQGARGPCNRISIDNESGIRAALKHLHDLGHRKLAIVKGHKDSADTEIRWRAVLDAAKALHLEIKPNLVVQLERLGPQQHSGIEEGERCAERLLDSGERFTAVVAFNDVSAMGVMKRLRESGRSVPEDTSVIGFDDVPAARMTYPALTTLRQPLRQMGEMAARILIEAITQAGPQHQHIALQPELIVRASTAVVPQHTGERSTAYAR